MHLLVTAGNTLAPIDRVRCITNIFTGRTGAAIGLEAFRRGHSVHLLTSHPEVVPGLAEGRLPAGPGWLVQTYRTFEDLQQAMHLAVQAKGLDAVVHCAAVSDYLCAGVYAPADRTCFDPADGSWQGQPPTLMDRQAGKVKSDVPELWLRLVRAPKLIDHVRGDWRFAGILVKFKLEVGLEDNALLEVAERSRKQSLADLMVANTLEGASECAFIGNEKGMYRRVARADLPPRLLDAIEQLHGSRRES